MYVFLIFAHQTTGVELMMKSVNIPETNNTVVSYSNAVASLEFAAFLYKYIWPEYSLNSQKYFSRNVVKLAII